MKHSLYIIVLLALASCNNVSSSSAFNAKGNASKGRTLIKVDANNKDSGRSVDFGGDVLQVMNKIGAAYNYRILSIENGVDLKRPYVAGGVPLDRPIDSVFHTLMYYNPYLAFHISGDTIFIDTLKVSGTIPLH